MIDSDTRSSILIVALHDQTWFKCPWCGNSFEDCDVILSHNFTKTDTEGVYIHKCGNKVYHN